jgi:hypothetical protein
MAIPGLLTGDQQQALLALLSKGASAAAACRQLGLPVENFWHTLHRNASFAAALQQAFDTLSHNVLSVLYQTAMKGNVTAQQFWLKHRPALHWAIPTETAPDDELYDALSYAELVDQARQSRLDVDAEIAGILAPPVE